MQPIPEHVLLAIVIFFANLGASSFMKLRRNDYTVPCRPNPNACCPSCA